MAFGRWVIVLWRDTDRYGRIYGKVLTPTWVNHRLVADGHAWHFQRYSKSEILAAAEQDARAVPAITQAREAQGGYVVLAEYQYWR